MELNQKQRQNLAGYFYALSKLTYAGYGVSVVVSKEPNLLLILIGLCLASIQAAIALWLEKGGE